MKHTLTIIIGILLAVLISCKDDSVDGVFTAKLVGNTIILENPTDQDVYFFIADQGALIQWAPSVDDDQPVVRSGQTATVGFSEAAAVSSSTTAVIVYYWNAIIEDGQAKPGEVKSIVLE